jgi:uncharacterized membrane protein (UPF0127 family)
MKLKFTHSFLNWLLIIVFCVIVSVLIFLGANKNVSENKAQQGNIEYVRIANKLIKVDLALTEESQEEGLSGRNFLNDDQGMLFVFNIPDKYSFWMKDMNSSIDIIWISDAMHVVYIKKDATPQSYPDSFTPGAPAKYVLEVVSGFSEKNNLKEGDTVEFLP